MRSNSLLYSIKVWLTSVIIAPVIYLLIESCLKRDYYSSITDYMNEEISKYAMCVLFGGIFSLLTWVIFLFIIKGLIASCPSSRQIKHLIAVAGVVLTAGTFALAMPEAFHVHNEFFYLMLANCICIAGGSWYYNLEIRSEPEVIID
jgi:hypothetical protein